MQLGTFYYKHPTLNTQKNTRTEQNTEGTQQLVKQLRSETVYDTRYKYIYVCVFHFSDKHNSVFASYKHQDP